MSLKDNIIEKDHLIPPNSHEFNFGRLFDAFQEGILHDEYFYKGYPKTVQLCKSNFESIYEFLNLNDVFIGCCGNTSFEALHAGLPIINIVQNHLQNRNAQILQKKYGFPNLGFYPTDDKILELFKGEIFHNLLFYST